MNEPASDPAVAPVPAATAFPPVDKVGAVVVALVVAGGIDLAAHLPQAIPLAPVTVLLAAAGVLVVVNVVSLVAVRSRFAWRPFRRVGAWALAAYLVIAGMLEYVFVLDGTRGATLVVLTLMLVVFAVNIPMILAFSVARHQPVGRAPTG